MESKIRIRAIGTMVCLATGLIALAGCGSSAPRTAKVPPKFTPQQVVAGVGAMVATKLMPRGIAAGSETYGLTMHSPATGQSSMESASHSVDGSLFIAHDFGDPTYFENNPTATCDWDVSLSSATGGGRSKRADKLQAKIVDDLRAACASDPLTGEEIAQVLNDHGFAIQEMAAGSSSSAATQVRISVKRSAKQAAEHVAVFKKNPLPGHSFDAVGSLAVESRGARTGTIEADPSVGHAAAVTALQSAL